LQGRHIPKLPSIDSSLRKPGGSPNKHQQHTFEQPHSPAAKRSKQADEVAGAANTPGTQHTGSGRYDLACVDEHDTAAQAFIGVPSSLSIFSMPVL
jgi:hypothetical protein